MKHCLLHTKSQEVAVVACKKTVSKNSHGQESAVQAQSCWENYWKFIAAEEKVTFLGVEAVGDCPCPCKCSHNHFQTALIRLWSY